MRDFVQHDLADLFFNLLLVGTDPLDGFLINDDDIGRDVSVIGAAVLKGNSMVNAQDEGESGCQSST